MDQSAICVLLASPFPMMNNLGDGNNGLVERLLWAAISTGQRNTLSLD